MCGLPTISAAAKIIAVATAAAAVTTTAAVAAAATTATGTIFARTSLVDLELTAAEFGAVEFCNGFLAILLGAHLDKAKATRAARLAVLDDRCGLDCADTGKKLLEIAARGLE